MRWTGLIRAFVVAMALAMTVPACSSGGTPSDAGGNGGDGGDGGAGDAAADVPPEPLDTCLMVRNCIYLCRNIPGCAEDCVDRAEPAARAVYDTVVSCSEQACPAQDFDCRCNNECYADGACVTQVDECTQSLQEGFCTACV